MSAQTLADVLATGRAGHGSMTGQSMADVILRTSVLDLQRSLALAKELEAAGFGHIETAKADAWDDLCSRMQDDLTDSAPNYSEGMRQGNSYRKAQR